MNRRLFLMLALAGCLTLIGCVRMPGGVAPSNIPIQQDAYRVLGAVTAADCKINFLGLLPISSGNRLWDAMAEAKREIPGTDALVDITVDRTFKYFILWSQVCSEVHATAVRLK